MNEPLGDPVLLEGHAAFAAQALLVVAGARSEVAVLSQSLETGTYGTEAFSDALRKFILQHEHTRLRVLVANPQVAVGNAIRLVELGRKLTTFVEFRELGAERKHFVREEYLIADGRVLLYREDPTDLESKFYGTAPPVARLKQKDFDGLWNESTTAQELRDLKL